MIIEEIKLENFKSHEYTVINFNPGISIIMGENGAGKSSILEAVSFALFKEHKTKIDQLVQNDKNRMRVSLKFSSNGRHYRINRKRQRGTKSTSRLEVMENNRYNLLVSGEKQVNSYIKEILEMDSDLFLNAVYVKQGEIADLINKSAADKKKMIGRLLGIENLQKSWENMRHLLSIYENKRENLKGKLETLKDTQLELEEKKKDEKLLVKNIKILDEKIKSLNNDLEDLNGQKSILNDKKDQFNFINNKIESKGELLDQSIENEKGLKKELESIKSKEEKIVEIKPQISKLEPLNKVDKNFNQLNQLQSEKNSLKESLNKIKKFKTILSENEEKYTEFITISSKIKELNSKRKDYEGSKALKDQYNTRKQTLHNNIVKSQDKIITSLNDYGKKLGEKFSKVEDLQKHVKVTKPPLEEEIQSIESKIDDIKGDIIELKSQIKNFKKPINELEKVENECPICQSKITPEIRENLINNYQSEISINKENIHIYSENKRELKNKRDVLNSKMKIINETKIDLLKEQLTNLNEYKTEYGKIEADIREIESGVEQLVQIDEKLQECIQRQEAAEKSYKKYLGAKNVLQSFESPDKLKKCLNQVESRINSFKAENEKLLFELETVPKNIEDEIKRLEKLKEQYDQLRGQISSKEEIVSKIEDVMGKITSLQKELIKLRSDLNELDYDQNKHQTLIETINNENTKLTNLTADQSKNIGKREELAENIENLKKRLELFKKDQRELIKINDFIVLLNDIRKLFGKDGLQKDLRNISRPMIEQNTRAFFEKFNFEYSDIKIDENYDITVYGPSGESQLEMVSGGERIAVALALRLGITQVLSKGALELIMLDEPTIHLDSYRRKELVDLLKQMSIIPQMIIVTHDTDLEEAADNILKIEKSGGVSMLSNST